MCVSEIAFFVDPSMFSSFDSHDPVIVCALDESSSSDQMTCICH